ncbi:MAG: choice-of-anchor E domain-containing protein, partial [Alphaproteobacteria bacterium]|nr:choice-of-anchor E domain-containing protein [Alphaproteobacteria bacterium]
MVAAALVLGSFPTLAAAITDTASIPLTLQPWSQNVSLPQFNAALGTLDQIQLSLTEGVQGAVTITNNDNVARDTTTGVSVFLTLQRPDLLTLVADSIGATFIQPGLGPHQSTTFSMLPQTVTNATVLAPPSVAELALFSGTGNVSLPVAASAFGSPSGPVSATLDIE